MKRAFLKFLLFLLPLLALAMGLELWLRRQPDFYEQKRHYLEAVLPDTRVLILGASQVNQGIRPDLLDPHAYNLAHVGQDFFYDAALTRKYAPRMPRLKLVVLPVAYVSLEYRFPGTPEEWRTFCYGVHFGLPNEIPRLNWDPRQYSLLALTEPLNAARQWCGFGATDVYRKTRPDGFQSVEPLEPERLLLMINEVMGRNRARYHQSIMKPENIPLNLADLQSLMIWLKPRGVKLVLITTPVLPDYARAIDRDRWRNDQAKVRALAARQEVPYHDYFDAAGFRQEDFSDVDHLNRDGAAKFTRMLKHELDKEGLL